MGRNHFRTIMEHPNFDLVATVEPRASCINHLNINDAKKSNITKILKNYHN